MNHHKLSTDADVMPEQLRRLLLERKCVAFVGAGFSMACGMPDWKALLVNLLTRARAARKDGRKAALIRDCEYAISRGHFGLAADIIAELMPRPDIDATIREQFGTDRYTVAARSSQKRMANRLRHLIAAPWAGIVTTNYDELIEHEIVRSERRGIVRFEGDNPRLGSVLSLPPSNGFFFVKLHGSIGSDIVLGSDEYDRTYVATPRMTDFLTALMLRYHLVFIGCSLEDEILRCRRRLGTLFGQHLPRAYAFLPETRWNLVRRASLEKNAQIECVFYPTKDKEHASVDEFLRTAAGLDLGASEVSRQSLKRLSVGDRLKSVGELNRQLLRLIASQSGHRFSHLNLLNISLAEDVAVSPDLASMTSLTPGERVYRTLFLCSVELATELHETHGSVVYHVPDDVVLALNTSE